MVTDVVVEFLNLQPCQQSMLTTDANFAMLGGDSLTATRVVRTMYANHHGVPNSRHLGGAYGSLEGAFAVSHLVCPAVLLSLPFATDYCQPIITPQEDRPSWKQRLLQVSNIASMLCVVDCTVLPLITILLTVLGMAEQPEKMQWLHSFGHHMAVYFVLPGTYVLQYGCYYPGLSSFKQIYIALTFRFRDAFVLQLGA